MDNNSPTDNGNDQSSSDSRNDESLLDNGQQHQSAEDTQGTNSGEQSQDSDTTSSERQDDSTRDGGSTDDDGLAKFAKAQGIENLDDLSERELRLLKVARDNQKSARTKQAGKDKEELDSAVSDLHDPTKVDDEGDEYLKEVRQTRMELAQMRAKARLQDFYRENAEAEEYAAEMRQALVNEVQNYGEEAGRVLSQNLPRLLREAKALRGDGHDDAEAAREAGRREEREALRRRQEAGGESHSAQQHGSGSSNKVTRRWIAETYDPSNSEHRAMLDEAMAKGNIPD